MRVKREPMPRIAEVFCMKKKTKDLIETGLKMPDDYTVNGWNRGNNYLLVKEEWEDKQAYARERYKRAMQCFHSWQKSDEYRQASVAVATRGWEERAAAAKKSSDTTEVLLLEKLVARDGGSTTAEMIATAINGIANELSRRAQEGYRDMDTKELVLISNTLTGLAKAASAVKKAEGWKPQVQVNNVTVNNSSKTGGVVGGLKDVIDIRPN